MRSVKEKTKKKGAPKKNAARKTPHKKRTTKNTSAKKSSGKKWSKQVNETSDALDLEKGVFKKNDPEKIARSLKRSAAKSKRRKASPYQSAMSMLNFYTNRGGKNLPASKKKVLEKSKDALRKEFGREE